MIKYDKGSISRLGNRTTNQDRGCVIEHEESLLIFVADGMGGHKGGELAAQEAQDTFVRNLRSQQTPIENPAVFLQMTMLEAHKNIAKLRSDEDPPYYPRTTCVACLVQQNQAWWVHLGDSRLYLLRDSELMERTRDHTYIEELYQNDVITEEEMLTHPMRNYVTYCIGGPNEMPPVSSGHCDELEANDVILLCSDGLWGALNVEDINKLSSMAMETAIYYMAEEAERVSYPNSDNVTLVGIRVVATEPVTS
jgi:serine/threonine protein phosphatase PrpC